MMLDGECGLKTLGTVRVLGTASISHSVSVRRDLS